MEKIVRYVFPKDSEAQLLIIISGLLAGVILWLAQEDNARQLIEIVLRHPQAPMLIGAAMIVIISLVRAIFWSPKKGDYRIMIGALTAYGGFTFLGILLFYGKDLKITEYSLIWQINLIVGYVFYYLSMARLFLTFFAIRLSPKITGVIYERIFNPQTPHKRLFAVMSAVAMMVIAFNLTGYGPFVSTFLAVNYVLAADLLLGLTFSYHRMNIYRPHETKPKENQISSTAINSRGYKRTRRRSNFSKSI